MVDAVVVANESIGDAAQFQQAIPVGVVACQTRDFQTEDDADVSQGNFAGQASEPGTFVGTGSGEPEVFIDGDHLLLRDGPRTRSHGKAQILQFGHSLRLFGPAGPSGRSGQEAVILLEFYLKSDLAGRLLTL